MGIDVLNHMWVSVFSAYFVRQYTKAQKAYGSQPQNTVQFAREAMAVADAALMAYKVACDTDLDRALPLNRPEKRNA